MPIRAVAFDIGGVLERVGDPDVELGAKWQERLGLTPADLRSALAGVDPGGLIQVGGLSEAEYGARYAAALGLAAAQTRDFMADLWDWHCGELDEDLVAFATSLRPRVRTAIVSNSAD